MWLSFSLHSYLILQLHARSMITWTYQHRYSHDLSLTTTVYNISGLYIPRALEINERHLGQLLSSEQGRKHSSHIGLSNLFFTWWEQHQTCHPHIFYASYFTFAVHTGQLRSEDYTTGTEVLFIFHSGWLGELCWLYFLTPCVHLQQLID